MMVWAVAGYVEHHFTQRLFYVVECRLNNGIFTI